jgi:hypothetical protein
VENKRRRVLRKEAGKGLRIRRREEWRVVLREEGVRRVERIVDEFIQIK